MENGAMKTQKTPQKKKRLSYQRDYVFFNVNNDKSSRKGWPAKKVRVNQEYRRKVNQALHTLGVPTRTRSGGG